MAPNWLKTTVPILALALCWPTGAPASASAPAAPARAVAAASVPASDPVEPAAASRKSAHTTAAERRKVDQVLAPKIGWFRARGWGYYLATVHLPLDYDHPNGAKVEIALAKVKAADPSRRIGTLFLNPGGPGGSGVELAQQAASFLSDDILDRFDIVGFDPRGTNNGTRVKCFSGYRASTLTLQDLTGIPMGKGGLKRYLKAAKKLAVGCSTRGRRIASASSTAEVARDMEVLRRSVGDSKLSFLGFSYGTYLGEVYANMFPDRFRAIAIDGVIDPVEWRGTKRTGGVPMSLRQKAAEGAWKSLKKAFELCKAAGPDYCLLADPMASLKSVVAQLKAAPLLAGGTSMSYSDFAGALLTVLYNQSGGPEAAVELVATAQDALAGDPDDGAYLLSLLKKIRQTRAGFDFPYDNSDDAYSAVLCTDGAQPRSPSVWRRAIAKRAKKAPLFAEVWGWSDVQCARRYWKASDEDRYRGSFSRRTAKPVLIVGDYYDPATAYTGAVSTHRRMPRSWLLTSDSWGHTAYGTSDCVNEQVDAYLIHGRKPSEQVCQSDYVPFSQPLDDGNDGTDQGTDPQLTAAAASGMGPIITGEH